MKHLSDTWPNQNVKIATRSNIYYTLHSCHAYAFIHRTEIRVTRDTHTRKPPPLSSYILYLISHCCGLRKMHTGNKFACLMARLRVVRVRSIELAWNCLIAHFLSKLYKRKNKILESRQLIPCSCEILPFFGAAAAVVVVGGPSHRM